MAVVLAEVKKSGEIVTLFESDYLCGHAVHTVKEENETKIYRTTELKIISINGVLIG